MSNAHKLFFYLFPELNLLFKHEMDAAISFKLQLTISTCISNELPANFLVSITKL